ncbi:hypothetical protein JYT22_00035 [Endomicrobium sp. AH-315-J14]|nr:hypothetical protein [Endomicrobium sp. AH-315-J14]
MAACFGRTHPDPPTGPGGFGGGAAGDGGVGGIGGSGGVGGTGGIGGTGGTILLPPDICPGSNQTVDIGAPLAISADTSEYGNFYSTKCGLESGDGNEVVYQLAVKSAGTIHFAIKRGATGVHNASMYLRTQCDEDTSTKWCRDFFEDNETFDAHIEAGNYFLIVDSLAGTEGPFELSVTLNAATCGDLIVNPGEECDLGANQPGSGCVDCKFEEAGSPDVCPGDPNDIVQLLPGETVLPMGDTYNTTASKDDYSPSCGGEAGGHDNVHWVLPLQGGTLTATVGLDDNGGDVCVQFGKDDPGCWDRVIYASTVCDEDTGVGAQIACNDSGPPGAPETISFPVEAGTSYWIVVDGYDGQLYSYGTYKLRLKLE